MRKIILFSALFLLGHAMVLNAQHQSVRYSFFRLLSTQETATDIRALSSFGSADNIPPPLMGYMEEVRSDTLFIKVLYKERFSTGSGSAVTRVDTFHNVAIPTGINYLNVSGNMVQIDSQGQTTDTSWNETDSPFVLHPVGMKDVYKNSPKVLVYPNPANHILSFDKSTDYEAVQVYNSIGQCVAVYQKNSERSIDISALSKGIYFIKLYGKNSEIIGRARFVKTN